MLHYCILVISYGVMNKQSQGSKAKNCSGKEWQDLCWKTVGQDIS